MSESFFVNYTEPRETALREADIPYNIFSIRGQRGFVFEHPHHEKALIVLRSQIHREEPSEYEGVTILHLRRGNPAESPRRTRTEKKETTITFERVGRNSSSTERIEDVVREFLPKLKVKEVVLYDNDQDSAVCQPPRTAEGVLTVFFWASSSGTHHNVLTDGNSSPTHLWEMETVRRRGYWSVWHPSGDGFVIRDSKGVEVAEVIGTNLYIFFAITHYDFQNSSRVFQEILKEAIPFISMSEEERATFFQKQAEIRKRQLAEQEAREKVAREARKPESRRNYISACAGRYTRTLEGTKRTLTEGRAEIERLQTQLTRKIRETIGAERKVRQMETERSTLDEAYGKEFDKLSSIPKVLEVVAEGGVIKVFTDTLYCVDPRSQKKHEIGRFRIEISAGGLVIMMNLTRTVADMNAPHVSSGGIPCLGNISEIVPDLAGNYEFAALAMVCIQYLESVNVNDAAGTYIHEWPVAA